jgi:hypothetical protein
MPRLPGTFTSSPISSFSTRRSARALIRWISPISSFTRPSTSSAGRVQRSAASSAYRTSSGQSAKSEGYMRAARARHAATIRSEASPNTASVSPSARTIDSLPISASSVSGPSGPGSDFSSASTLGRGSRSCSRPHTTGPSRPAVVAAKSSSNRRQPEATTRSTWPVLGGSTFSLRRRRRSAAARRSRFVSVGHISAASHCAQRSSSASVGGRVLYARRICALWYSIVRPRHEYLANSAGSTITSEPR